MADVYFNGKNVGTLESALIEKIRDKEIVIRTRGGKAIVTTGKNKEAN